MNMGFRGLGLGWRGVCSLWMLLNYLFLRYWSCGWLFCEVVLGVT